MIQEPLRRGRPCKYVTRDEFQSFKNNDFRHIKWELHVIATLLAGEIGFLYFVLQILFNHIGN